MKINIHTSPPRQDELELARLKACGFMFCLALYTVGGFSVSFFTTGFTQVAVFVTTVLALFTAVHLGLDLFVYKLYSSINTNQCNRVIDWVARDATIAFYMGWVNKQGRELYVIEYAAMQGHINKETSRISKARLYGT